MSVHSDITTCPNCGGENLNTSNNNKPFDQVSGECLDCGLLYYTEVKQLPLKQLNVLRAEYKLEPLKKRKEDRLTI